MQTCVTNNPLSGGGGSFVVDGALLAYPCLGSDPGIVSIGSPWLDGNHRYTRLHPMGQAFAHTIHVSEGFLL